MTVMTRIVADVERRLILHTVKQCRTQEEAAHMLGISTKTLYRLILRLRYFDAKIP